MFKMYRKTSVIFECAMKFSLIYVHKRRYSRVANFRAGISEEKYDDAEYGLEMNFECLS